MSSLGYAVLHVPPREIPIPSHLSPQAQAVLAQGPVEGVPWPDTDDPVGWHEHIAVMDQKVLDMLAAAPRPVGSDVREVVVGQAVVYAITPHDCNRQDRRTYLELHGGAFVLGGGELCRQSGIASAGRLGCQVWSLDYRMPPDHPFPAALDDCLTAYRQLLADRDPGDIIVGGGSAGGNLAAALALRARDEGLPLPAALVIVSPGADLTASGDTHYTNFGVDTVSVLPSLAPTKLYVGNHDIRHPYVSPLYGDFAPGFPPTLLASGTRDVLLSDTVRLHRALRNTGVAAELHVLEAAPHGGFFGAAPEDDQLWREIRQFAERHWSASDGG